MAKRWSEEDIGILYKEYPILGAKKLVDRLNRAEASIQAKASSLGIKYLKYHYVDNPELYTEELKESSYTNIEKYIDARTPILHRCKKCSNEWKISPDNLRQRHGCPKCSYKLVGNTKRNSLEYVDSVLDKARLLRLNEYIKWDSILKVQSLECFHEWDTTFNRVQGGKGCPICNKGFGYAHKKELPTKAFIYLLNIGDECLKIGVTTKDISSRIRNIIRETDINNITCIMLLETTGFNALDIENRILKKYPRFTSNLEFSGYTELIPMEYKDIIIKELTNEQPKFV